MNDGAQTPVKRSVFAYFEGKTIRSRLATTTLGEESSETNRALAHPQVALRGGQTLEMRLSSPKLAHLQVQYQVYTGKPCLEPIEARRAWQADLTRIPQLKLQSLPSKV
jgi:hypothetical protein